MSAGHRTAYLLGQGISQSLSPAIHNAAFQASGLPYRYELLDISPDRLDWAINRLRQPDSLGSNITMPYKSAVLAAAGTLSDSVTMCGAGNLLVNQAGLLSLHNTDVEAIARVLQTRSEQIRDSTVVIVGAGGSAAATLAALSRIPVGRVRLAVRRTSAGEALAVRARRWLHAPIEVIGSEATAAFESAAVVFNMTPLGSHSDDPLPMPTSVIRRDLLIYDIVYRRDGPTKLQRIALEQGALVTDGAGHLLTQAGPTFELLTGETAPVATMLAAFVSAVGRRPLLWDA